VRGTSTEGPASGAPAMFGTPAQAKVVTVTFTEMELALILERAAAHDLTVLEFMRFVALCCPTPLEEKQRQPEPAQGGNRP
jgi:hypothetical protein